MATSRIHSSSLGGGVTVRQLAPNPSARRVQGVCLSSYNDSPTRRPMRPVPRKDSYDDDDSYDEGSGDGSARKWGGSNAGMGQRTDWDDEGSETIIEPVPRGPPRNQRDSYTARPSSNRDGSDYSGGRVRDNGGYAGGADQQGGRGGYQGSRGRGGGSYTGGGRGYSRSWEDNQRREPEQAAGGEEGVAADQGGYRRGGGYGERRWSGEGEGGGYGERRQYGGGGGGYGERRQYGGGGEEGYNERRRSGSREPQSDAQIELRQSLNAELRQASSWAELATFVEQKGSMMDSEHASQPTGRYNGPINAAALQRPRGDEAAAQQYDRLLSTLLGWVLTLLPSFRIRQVSTVISALAKLDLWNAEVVTALVASASKSMVNVEPIECCNMLQALAKFNYNPGPEFISEFLLRSPKKLRFLDAQDLARTANAMSKIGCVPTPEWAEAFWKASSEKMREVSDVTLGDFFMATASFAQAGVQPPQEWVDQVFGSIVETDQARSARMAELQQEYEQAVRQSQKEGRADDVVPKPQIEERRLPRIATINKLLYTLSNLSFKPGPAFFNALTGAWRRQLKISVAIFSRRTLKESDRMNGDDMAAVAYLLATSGFKGREREVDDLVFSLKQKLGGCTLSGLEMIYNALPSIGSGYRLNETVTEAANRYNGLLAVQQQSAEVPEAITA